MGWYNSKVRFGPLGQAIVSLKAQLASAAQSVYDAWEDADGVDIEFGGGGICDQVSQAMSDILGNIPNAEITEGGQDGDDHAYLIVYNDAEAYEVDIPPNVYETGSGYSWKKIPNVTIDANSVVVSPLNRNDYEF